MIRRWPYPYRFAFGITDDTDGTTLEKTKVFYEACLDRFIVPTRTVWCFPPDQPSGIRMRKWDRDPTLSDADYRDYILRLKDRGVEIALHGVSAGNNDRNRQHEGFRLFRSIFGAAPRLYVCHARNRENPYWGSGLLPNPLLRWLSERVVTSERFEGHDPSSPYYWSDLCSQSIDYVRRFRTLRLNVLSGNPSMPYHSPAQPDVRFWFSAVAQDGRAFRKITYAALNRVARQNGAIILYIHSAHAVDNSGILKDGVRNALDIVRSRSDCWSAPVSTILDRCMAIKNLLVARRRNALVISNPGNTEIRDVQLRVPHKALFTEDGRVLKSEGHVIVIPAVAPRSCTSYFYDPASAALGDTAGIGKFEEYRMIVEEGVHLLWQNLLGNGIRQSR